MVSGQGGGGQVPPAPALLEAAAVACLIPRGRKAGGGVCVCVGGGVLLGAKSKRKRGFVTCYSQAHESSHTATASCPTTRSTTCRSGA
jgi:hypothetical protein